MGKSGEFYEFRNLAVLVSYGGQGELEDWGNWGDKGEWGVFRNFMNTWSQQQEDKNTNLLLTGFTNVSR